jgi:DNA-binding transcriptional ArsR family regulator
MTPRQPSKNGSPLPGAMRTESDYQSCAARLKALADPDRLRIVNNLLRGERCVTQLADELGVPIDKVSHHLGVLRAAHFVHTQRRGKFVIYSLLPEVADGMLNSQGAKTIDLGCCQLDLLQPEPLPAKPRANSRRNRE